MAAVHHPLLESLRTLIPTYSTTVVLDVGILGLLISQRSLLASRRTHSRVLNFVRLVRVLIFFHSAGVLQYYSSTVFVASRIFVSQLFFLLS